MKAKLLIIILFVGIGTTVQAQDSWRQFVSDLRAEAIQQGVEPSFFDRTFKHIRPNRSIRQYAVSQPEHRLRFDKYRRTRGSKYRILMGKRNYKKNKVMLDQIGREFGVDPCFITSFWGMETSYGTFMGSFPVIKSLATLAYNSKRKKFFRQELLFALQIVQGGHVNMRDYKGEWAGASGQPQFLPSSWRHYAVDYNRDGKKDIWKTKADVFASIANYVKQKGWKTGEPWAIEVRTPRSFDMSLEGRKTTKPVSDWNAMGVRTLTGQELPYQNLNASIVKPYGGPTFLAFDNFKVIMKYNASTYYAGTIGHMADKICGRKYRW